MTTVLINATGEFASAGLAIQDLDASGSGDRVISLDGRYFTVSHGEYERLEQAGVPFDTWHDLDGRLICVP